MTEQNKSGSQDQKSRLQKIIDSPALKKLDYKKLLMYGDSNDTSILLEVDTALRSVMENYFKRQKNTLTYTQLRTIHQLFVGIDSDQYFVKMLPKLAYIEARQDSDVARLLVEFIRELLQKAIELNKQSAFKECLNALVAYHKFYSI